jgi:hypothetical protein
MAVSVKVNHTLTLWSSTFIIRHFCKAMKIMPIKSLAQEYSLKKNIHYSFISYRQNLEIAQVPIYRKIDKQVHLYKGMLYTQQHRWNSETLCYLKDNIYKSTYCMVP